jgi:hypothetical protein
MCVVRVPATGVRHAHEHAKWCALVHPRLRSARRSHHRAKGGATAAPSHAVNLSTDWYFGTVVDWCIQATGGPSVLEREAAICKEHSLEHGALPIWLRSLIDRCEGSTSAPGVDFQSSAIWAECKMQEVLLATSELEQPNLFRTAASMYLYQVPALLRTTPYAVSCRRLRRDIG